MTLDMQALRKRGHLVGGKHEGSSLWTYPAIGSLTPERLFGAVAYEVDTAGDEGLLRISRIVEADPLGKPVERAGHVVRLVAAVPPFGGLRWWFVCPLSGRRVSKLYLPRGAAVFASQKAHRLGYGCQRESDRDRAFRRARKARRRLGGSVNLSERLPPKPKWMRWRTYARLRSQVDSAQATADRAAMVCFRLGRGAR